jgi:hypothetical protein
MRAKEMRLAGWPRSLAEGMLVVALGLGVAGAEARESASNFDPDYASAPSYVHAGLDAKACLADLRRRKVDYEPVDQAPGVLVPVRLPKGVGGVTYRTLLPREQGRSSPWEVFDCRLVLSLLELSEILAQHRIDEVIMFSAWRPPGKKWPKDKLAVRHPGALAIDVMRFGRDVLPQADAKPPAREWLDVEKHFHGRIGDTSCGPGASSPTEASPEAKELRALVCEVAAARIFTSVLTPNHDKAHNNHVHFDLAVDVKWRMVR